MAWSTEAGRYRGVTPRQAARIRRRDNHTCQSCGARGHEVDHIINAKAGGGDADDNLQTLCTDCHRVKTQAEAQAALQARRDALTLPQEAHPLWSATHRPGGGLRSDPREGREA